MPVVSVVRPVGSRAEIEAVRGLFEEYQRWLGLDLGFQGFAAELAALPGDYAPSRGALLAAFEGDEAVGCVALRPTAQADTAELKRLYVRSSARGRGLGRILAERALAVARSSGYRRVVLDTLPVMGTAHDLYRSLGFRDIEPYYENPIPGARYLALDLDTPLDADRAASATGCGAPPTKQGTAITER